MIQKRDSQKIRVEEAEFEWMCSIKTFPAMHPGMVELFVRSVLKEEGFPIEHIQICFGTKGKSFFLGQWVNIYLPKIACMPVVLHELAHVISKHHDHGAEFCKTMLRITSNYHSRTDAGLLLEKYKIFKAKIY